MYNENIIMVHLYTSQDYGLALKHFGIGMAAIPKKYRKCRILKTPIYTQYEVANVLSKLNTKLKVTTT